MLRIVVKKHMILTLTVVCLLVASSSAHAQTLLRWKFKPGEAIHYIFTQEMTVKAQIADTIPMTITMPISFIYLDTWKIKSVDQEGVATIDRTIDRIQVKIEGPLKKQGPQGVLIEFDSASDKEPTGMAKVFAQVANAMVKNVTVLRISPRGEVLEAEPPKGLLESVKKILPGVNSFGDFFSAEGTKKMQANISFPKEPVTKGQTWPHKENYQLPALLGTLGVEERYEYLGTEHRDGTELQKIAITVLMASGDEKHAEGKRGEEKQSEPKQPARIMRFKPTVSTGTIYFDNAQGRILGSNMKMKVQAESNIVGKQVMVDMEGSLRIELEPAEGVKRKLKL